MCLSVTQLFLNSFLVLLVHVSYDNESHGWHTTAGALYLYIAPYFTYLPTRWHRIYSLNKSSDISCVIYSTDTSPSSKFYWPTDHDTRSRQKQNRNCKPRKMKYPPPLSLAVSRSSLFFLFTNLRHDYFILLFSRFTHTHLCCLKKKRPHVLKPHAQQLILWWHQQASLTQRVRRHQDCRRHVTISKLDLSPVSRQLNIFLDKDTSAASDYLHSRVTFSTSRSPPWRRRHTNGGE